MQVVQASHGYANLLSVSSLHALELLVFPFLVQLPFSVLDPVILQVLILLLLFHVPSFLVPISQTLSILLRVVQFPNVHVVDALLVLDVLAFQLLELLIVLADRVLVVLKIR